MGENQDLIHRSWLSEEHSSFTESESLVDKGGASPRRKGVEGGRGGHLSIFVGLQESQMQKNILATINLLRKERQTEERVHVPVEVSVHVRREGTIYAFLMLLASIRGHQRWPRLIFPLCVKTPPGEEYIHV